MVVNALRTECQFLNHHILGPWILYARDKDKGKIWSEQNQFCLFLKWDEISLGWGKEADSEGGAGELRCRDSEKRALSLASLSQAFNLASRWTETPSVFVIPTRRQLVPPFLGGVWKSSGGLMVPLTPHIWARPRRSRIGMAQRL